MSAAPPSASPPSGEESVNDLYSAHARLYSVIADDRDFHGEVHHMGAHALGRGDTFVELFAGPAFHSIALRELGSEAGIVAIDNAAEMADEALRRGFSGTYHVADAIEGLAAVACARIVCIPRYSVALVDDAYLHGLLEAVASRLRISDGTLLIEMHPAALVDYAEDPPDWSELGIHRRVIPTSEGEIECIWPNKVSVVDPAANLVEMEIRVSRRGADDLQFASREHLRSRDALIAIANTAGLRLCPDRSFETDNGRYLAFSAEPLS